MNKILERCAIDGDLTPALVKRKAELDAAMEAELAEVEAGRGQMWVPKHMQCADIRQKYELLWEDELQNAGYLLRPVFESVERPSFGDWYEELNKIN